MAYHGAIARKLVRVVRGRECLTDSHLLVISPGEHSLEAALVPSLTAGSRVHGAARKIAHDRRLPKPAILATMNEDAAVVLGGGAAAMQLAVPRGRGRRCGSRLCSLLFTSQKSPMPAQSSLASPVAPVRRVADNAAFLNVKGAAEYLGLSPHTLYVWRHRRQGPPSFRMGPRGRVMYRRAALDSWIREQEGADSRSNTELSPLCAAPEKRLSRLSNA